MLRQRVLTAAIFLAATASFHGCLDADNSPVETTDDAATDEQAIESIAFEEMGEYTDLDPRFYASDAEDLPQSAPIGTQRWRRQLLHFEKTLDITIHKPDDAPATANVTMSGESTGLLHLWEQTDEGVMRWAKDFDDHGTRRLVFQKVRPTLRPHRGWKLVALSGVAIESAGTTRAIRSVRVQARGVDQTITNVTDLVRVGALLNLPNESEVVVTVATGDATDSVFLHLRHDRRRMELENHGDGTFSGHYMTGPGRGPRHAVVDVLSQDTLYDDTAPYDNVAWGFTYLVGDVDPEL
jgi:hypothetical protein